MRKNSPSQQLTAAHRRYENSADLSGLNIPSKTPERTTRILIVLQLSVVAQTDGDWTIEISFQPNGDETKQYRLPKVRIETVLKNWIPVVSGLNSKTEYHLIDLKEVQTRFASNILQEMRSSQSHSANNLLLDHPAITSNVLIARENQFSLDASNVYFEKWLKPLALAHPETKVQLLTEKQRTRAGSASKTKKTLALEDLLVSKTWHQIFAAGGAYQTVNLSIFSKDFEHPIAGAGLQLGFRPQDEAELQKLNLKIATTLSKMRGAEFVHASSAPAIHVFNWVINHPSCYRWMETSTDSMREELSKFANSDSELLQAWHSSCTWHPFFDTGGEYRRTVYEESGILNWFRGISEKGGGGLNEIKMSAGWCENVLRMVAPHMWLSRKLIEQVDRTALELVTNVAETNETFRIVLKEGHPLDALELALLPILPVESSRIKVV